MYLLDLSVNVALEILRIFVAQPKNTNTYINFVLNIFSRCWVKRFKGCFRCKLSRIFI